MRRLDDYTNDELCQMSEQDVAHLVEVECAHAGAPLLPDHPGEAPAKSDDLAPTMTVHVVADHSFVTHEDATRVAELIGSIETADVGYVSGPSYSKKVRRVRRQTPSISTDAVYSEEQANRIAANLEHYEDQKSEWSRRKSEYDEAVEKREGVRSRVRTAISEAKDAEQHLLDARARFDRYLGLADNDHHIAWRFFANAYASMAEDEQIRDMLRPADFVDDLLEAGVSAP